MALNDGLGLLTDWKYAIFVDVFEGFDDVGD